MAELLVFPEDRIKRSPDYINRLQENLIPSAYANGSNLTQEEIINNIIINSGKSLIEHLYNMGFVVDDEFKHITEHAFTLIGAALKNVYGMEDEYEDLISTLLSSHLEPLTFYPEELE